MGLPILYFKGSQVEAQLEFLKFDAFVMKICFYLYKHSDPDEMPHNVTFIWVFTVCQGTCLQVSRLAPVLKTIFHQCVILYT